MFMTIVTLLLLVFSDGCTLIPAEWKMLSLVVGGVLITSYLSQKLVQLRHVLS